MPQRGTLPFVAVASCVAFTSAVCASIASPLLVLQ